MDIGNRNTNRVKFFMRKRLEIAVFLAVLLGIALTVSRYFEFVSKTVYEESVSHLTEVFHQSNNVLNELTNKNLTYLHMWTSRDAGKESPRRLSTKRFRSAATRL